MQATPHALWLALSCTDITNCLPASCCGMLKDSSSSPKRSLESNCIKSVGRTDGVPVDPFPMWKVMLTLTWGLVVTGLMICGLVGWEEGWEEDSVGTLGWGATGSVLESKVIGSDRAEWGLWRAMVDCKGLMDSKLLQPSVLVKVSVLLLLWLWSLQASPFSSRHCCSSEVTVNEVCWISPK